MIPLAIGTAQFGQSYGVCNKDGPVEGVAAQEIVDLALQSGIRFFDTARVYGDSESVLGSVLPVGEEAFIITKFSADSENPSRLIKDCEDSLRRLGRERVHAVLIHNVQSLLGVAGHAIRDAIETMRERRYTDKIGVSVYTPEDFFMVTERFKPDIVQIPCNVLDQRFLSTDIQNIKNQNKIEFHARSLFLQGVLIDPPSTIPDFMKDKQRYFADIESAAASGQATGMDICLSFARDCAEKNLIDRWIVGVESRKQLNDIVRAVNSGKNLSIQDWKPFQTDDLAVIDPRTWKGRDA